jgi:hypothetical protein
VRHRGPKPWLDDVVPDATDGTPSVLVVTPRAALPEVITFNVKLSAGMSDAKGASRDDGDWILLVRYEDSGRQTLSIQ